jgi:hypothetical protein
MAPDKFAQCLALVAALLLSVVIGACLPFGPMDGQFYVMGSAPTDAPCTVALIAARSGHTESERSVSGPFRESFIAGPTRGGHRVTLRCGQAVIATRTFQYGRDVGIGGELALVRDAP